MADTLGYRATFWITAVLLVIAGLLILTLVQEQFTPSEEVTEGNSLKRMGWDFGMILGTPLLGLVLLLHFGFRIGVRISSPTVPLVVQLLMPDSALLGSASGLLTTISGISSALAAPMVGRWADRGHMRPLLLISAFLSALAMGIQAVAPSYWLLLAGQFILGLGMGGSMAVINAYIGRLAPEDRVGTAFGLDATAVSLAGAVGPPVGGWLSDTVTRTAPFWVGCATMALAGLAALRLPHPSSVPAEVQEPYLTA